MTKVKALVWWWFVAQCQAHAIAAVALGIIILLGKVAGQ